MGTHSAAARTVLADAAVDLVDGGATDATGDLVILQGVTVLARILCQNPAFGAASGPTAALLGVPLNVAAIATGIADTYEFQDRDNNVVFTGSVSGTGGGAEIELDNTSLVNTELVTITGFNYTAAP